jgi:hypothetical protein
MKTLTILFFSAILAGCGSKQQDVIGPQYAERPEGCDVTLFHDTPTGPSVNIGPVRATCAEDVPQADCLRTLKDQVCKLGGDIVWGVPGEPMHRYGKLEWSGRAAHTK